MTSQPEERIRAEIVEVGRRLHERGYVASNDGNISVRLDDNRVLTTPTGVSKGFMTPDMMVTTDMQGVKLTGDRKASSELLMHLAVYEHRPEIKAIVHAHPPAATGFAVAGIPLDRAVLAEVIVTLGSIPIAEYGTPSTSELADAVRKYISAHDQWCSDICATDVDWLVSSHSAGHRRRAGYLEVSGRHLQGCPWAGAGSAPECAARP